MEKKTYTISTALKQITEKKIFLCFVIILLMLITTTATAMEQNYKLEENGLWVATAYCKCHLCTNKYPSSKEYGITASGRRAMAGHTVACNWLPFGSRLIINGKVYTVEDRGARSLFGDRQHHIKHVDIFFNSHREALKFGRQVVEVTVCN